MAKFDELSEGELSRLKQLGEAEPLWKKFFETSDDIRWQYHPEISDGEIDIEYDMYRPYEEKARSTNVDVKSHFPALMHHIKRWADVGYVDISPNREEDRPRFILTPRGRAYLAYQAKPRWRRWLIDTWADWRPELRSAVVSAVTSLIVALITAYLVLRLGLK